ncbi:MAG: sulfide-dependent adenosine diphosphate thiazole synthase, partial [Candidatus Omnitrophota bacterium]
LDELKISRAIIESYYKKLLDSLDVDVAIAGAGPSGMVCSYYLAKAGKKVAIFERRLSAGGGIWGGGMMFNEIVLQPRSKGIFDELGIKTRKYEEGYYLADSLETASGLCFGAIRAGVRIFNLISVEDVMVRKNRVCGLVLNWSAVEMANLHVDPVTIKSKFVVDATGHAAEIAHIVEKKSGIRLQTKTGRVIGEQSMWAEVAEATIVRNSGQVCPGLYVCGMAANAVFGGPRMGPIFGGMVLSGRKVAQQLLRKL